MCEHAVTGAACHCTACHRTFSSVSGFDAHQRMSGDGKIICLDPMVARDRKGREIWTVRPGTGIYVLASHGHTWGGGS